MIKHTMRRDPKGEDVHAPRRMRLQMIVQTYHGELSCASILAGDHDPLVTVQGMTEPDLLFLISSVQMILELRAKDAEAQALKDNPPEF